MSGPYQDHEEEESKTINKRLCDFCGESTAVLYCRADSAKLCLTCDREVHSTNQLFTKHTRSQLCDLCDNSPASILCSTETLVLCHNCDWETHNGSSFSKVHDRRPVEGFNGCPNVSELCSIVGFDDLGKKDALFSSEERETSGGDCFSGSGDFGFSDFLVWETPSVISLDDLIGCTDSSHEFQAMGVPPLPKNRNAACGRHKEEILSQLRELAKLEPVFNFDHRDPDPLTGFEPLVPQQDIQSRESFIGCKREVEPNIFPIYEGSERHWCTHNGKGANEDVHSKLLGCNKEESCLLPDKYSEIGGTVSHASPSPEGQCQRPIISETSHVFPRVVHEFNSQIRDTALSRYKEKKKARRYDKHIRYESRKARAESRTRIKGRFAKIDR